MKRTPLARKPARRKPLKPRICKAPLCSETFVPVNGLQQTCSRVECALELVRHRQAKQERAEAKKAAMQARREHAEAKERVKPLPKLRSEAAEAIHKLVRELDLGAGFDCITCNGRKAITDPIRGGAYDAGHFHSRGSNPGFLAFSPLNIHAQCKACNASGGHTRQEYRDGLLRRYGPALVDFLDGAHPTQHYRAEDYRRMRDEARATLKFHNQLRREGDVICPILFRQELLRAEIARRAG